jgi:hypothetical protein
MAKGHTPRPDGNWDRPNGEILCVFCGARIMEAVYTGGWMHSNEKPHAFLDFVYSDGAHQVGGGCLECGRPLEAPIHTR